KSRQDLIRRRRAAPITQAELARLVRLREYDRERNELRASILDRLDAGADVEGGELECKGNYYEPHSVTWKQLMEVLDEGTVRDLQRALGHRQHRRLEIY